MASGEVEERVGEGPPWGQAAHWARGIFQSTSRVIYGPLFISTYTHLTPLAPSCVFVGCVALPGRRAPRGGAVRCGARPGDGAEFGCRSADVCRRFTDTHLTGLDRCGFCWPTATEPQALQ